MNLKTGILSLLTLASPQVQRTETIAQTITKPKTEIIVHNAKQEIKLSNARAVQGKALLSQAPALFREPKPEFANQRIGNKSYDIYGNVNGIYNSRNKLTRTISRNMEGNLYGYTDISYKPNGKKAKETVYSTDWNKKGGIGKFEERKYNGDGSVTVTSYNKNGKADFIERLKTEVIDGEEVIMPNEIVETINGFEISPSEVDSGCY